MNFSEAIVSGFKNYANAHGRASRSEYWYWFLFRFILGLIANICDAMVLHVPPHNTLQPVSLVVMFVFFCPDLAVGMRRLHDVDRNGRWILIAFTIVGAIFPLLIWNCRKGTTGNNRFGPDPLSAPGQPPL